MNRDLLHVRSEFTKARGECGTQQSPLSELEQQVEVVTAEFLLSFSPLLLIRLPWVLLFVAVCPPPVSVTRLLVSCPIPVLMLPGRMISLAQLFVPFAR